MIWIYILSAIVTILVMLEIFVQVFIDPWLKDNDL